MLAVGRAIGSRSEGENLPEEGACEVVTLEEGPGRILKALATTGMASALSAATTILSFAALTAAGNQGVRSLGLIIVLGLALVTLAAFTAVPLGWMTTWKVRGQVGKAEEDEE